MKIKKKKSAQDIYAQRVQRMHRKILRKISTERQKQAKEIGYKIYRKMSMEKKANLFFDFMNLGIELKLSEGTEIPLSYLKLWLKCN